MEAIRVSREVSAPAPVVWSIVTDIDGSVHTISAIEKVEILSGDAAFGLGFTWRETRTMFGKKATEEMTIVEMVDGESYVTEADPDGANYRSAIAVTSTGEGSSTVSMEFGADPKGTFTRLMGATVGKMFVGSMKKAIAADLDDIAAAAESAG